LYENIIFCTDCLVQIINDTSLTIESMMERTYTFDVLKEGK